LRFLANIAAASCVANRSPGARRAMLGRRLRTHEAVLRIAPLQQAWYHRPK
jgi:hypothetical protein